MSGLFHFIGCLFSQDARDNWRMEHDGTVNPNEHVYTVITDHEPTQTDGWKHTPANKSASGRGEWSEPIK